MLEFRNSNVRQGLLHAEKLLGLGRPLLLVGEIGCGKGYFAQLLHQRLFGSARPLIQVDCSQQDENPEISQGSTVLFLRFDLAAPERRAEWLHLASRQGAAVMATSEVELEPGFGLGNQIRIPPLRERREDIELLTCDYLFENAEKGANVTFLTADAISALLLYEWPGNLTELFSALHSAAKKAAGGQVDLRHLPPEVSNSFQPPPPRGLFKRYARSAELLLIRWALHTCGDDRTKAARFLGLSRAALYKKLKLYPEFRVAEI